MFAFVLVAFSVLFYQNVESRSNCTMMGTNPITKRTLIYNGPPKPLTDPKARKLLEQFCPNQALVSHETGQIEACCDSSQLYLMQEQLSMLFQLVSNCPQCEQAIIDFGCYLSCDTRQAEYTKVINGTKVGNYTEVGVVQYAVASDYINDMYNSCKSIKVPQTGDYFVKSVMCQTGKCDGEKMLHMMVMQAMTYTNIEPIIVYDKSKKNVFKHPMNSSVTPCYKEYRLRNNVTAPSCSCYNCEERCPLAPKFPKNSKEIVFKYFTVWQFSVGTVILFFLIIILANFIYFFIVCPIMKRIKKRASSDDESLVIDSADDMPIANSDFELCSNITSVESINEISNSAENIHSTDNKLIYGILQKIMVSVTKFSTQWAVPVIIASLLFSVSLSTGIMFKLEITSDPVDLWSPPHSAIKAQKDYYDKFFGGFYRTEQVIITKTKNKNNNSLILDLTTMHLISNITKYAQKLSTVYKDPISQKTINVTLKDICFQPLSPKIDACAILSVLQYFQNDVNKIHTSDPEVNWKKHVELCTMKPLLPFDDDYNSMPCLADYMGPVYANLVFGGYNSSNFTDGDTTIITFVVLNHNNTNDNLKAFHWEGEFLKYLKNLKVEGYEFSYSTERSIEDEISRESVSDIKTVVISYILMFAYVSFALGKIPKSIKTLLVDGKYMLGLIGVLIVMLSVTTSVGFFCYLGVKVNLITIEVLPFLILAVGVDNIFIMTHHYYKSLEKNLDNGEIDVQAMLCKAMKEVGPGMLISAACQISIFYLGALSDIPVVKTFSLFAATSLLINFLLQMTCFIAFFYFDCLREKKEIMNIFCCISLKKDLNRPKVGDKQRYFKSPIKYFIENVLAKFIFSKFVRLIVVTIFGLTWLLSVLSLDSLKLGLDQTTALPSDSYLQNYFRDVFAKLNAGPPVYFVIKDGFNYHIPKDQNKICSQSYCNRDSLSSYLYSVSLEPNESSIASPPTSWIDNYLLWLIPTGGDFVCCKKVVNEIVDGKKIPVNKPIFCRGNYTDESRYECETCLIHNELVTRPTESEFVTYLPWFLNDIPDPNGCSLGGKAAFGSSVILNDAYYKDNKTDQNPIITSYIMSYHTKVVKSLSFIDALEKAIYISKNISKTISHQVFPYSVFYVYYQAYLNIRNSALMALGICSAAILVVSMLLFSFDLRITFVVTLTIVMMDIVNAGVLFISGLQLNPVTLVNLIMLIGINVEFIAHMARAYLTSTKLTRLEKASEALVETGSSVFSGIAMTKLIGVVILGFSHSEIFKIYYFQMYIVAILNGILHSLIFFPIALSIFGTTRARRIYDHVE